MSQAQQQDENELRSRRTREAIPAEAQKVIESGHKIAQAWRSERTRRDAEVHRLWGIIEATFGGYAYKTLIENDRLSEEDKNFIRYMRNLATPRKFQKKA